MENYSNNVVKRFIFPVAWKLRKGIEIVLMTFILGAIGVGAYLSAPYLGKGNKADLRGGVNNFNGFAPGIAMNDGLKANKESRMYKEFGITVEFNIFDDMGKLNDALKNGDLDFIFTTTDISPISMDKTSDLAKIGVAQFVLIDKSRGADVFIVDSTVINTISDLKGKKIACALGWPSNTLLHMTLEAGGLTEKDVQIIPFADPTKAKEAYLSNQVDGTVVWAPDDAVCMNSRTSSKVLTSTALMPDIIMDGFIARKDVLEKKHDKFVKFAEAWLTANDEMKNESKLENAAQIFKVAFSVEDPIKDVIAGMKKIYFATYGDNLNFFGLSTDFTGITGQMLYNNMARVYKNGYGNNLSSITSWADASYPKIVQSIEGLGASSAEGQVEFTPATTKDVTAPAIATKRITVNFETASYVLTPNEKQNIARGIGRSALELSGFRIRVEGNTDNTGNRNLNIELSRKRAQSVVDFLVTEYKFDRNRFIIVGNGPDKAIASNDTESGRSANRRTDFEFIK